MKRWNIPLFIVLVMFLCVPLCGTSCKPPEPIQIGDMEVPGDTPKDVVHYMRLLVEEPLDKFPRDVPVESLARHGHAAAPFFVLAAQSEDRYVSANGYKGLRLLRKSEWKKSASSAGEVPPCVMELSKKIFDFQQPPGKQLDATLIVSYFGKGVMPIFKKAQDSENQQLVRLGIRGMNALRKNRLKCEPSSILLFDEDELIRKKALSSSVLYRIRPTFSELLKVLISDKSDSVRRLAMHKLISMNSRSSRKWFEKVATRSKSYFTLDISLENKQKNIIEFEYDTGDVKTIYVTMKNESRKGKHVSINDIWVMLFEKKNKNPNIVNNNYNKYQGYVEKALNWENDSILLQSGKVVEWQEYVKHESRSYIICPLTYQYLKDNIGINIPHEIRFFYMPPISELKNPDDLYVAISNPIELVVTKDE